MTCIPCVQAVGLEVGNSVLDVGSGSGYLTTLASHLAADAGSAVGIEVSTFGSAKGPCAEGP